MQLDLLHILIRLARRTTRWLLRNRRQNLNCSEIIEQFTGPMHLVLQQLAELHEVEWINLWSAEKANITELGVEDQLASRLAASDSMFISLGVVDTALQLDRPVQQVAKLYLSWVSFSLWTGLWPRLLLCILIIAGRIWRVSPMWMILRGSVVRLTANLCMTLREMIWMLLVEGWQRQQAPLIERWKLMIKDLRHGPTAGFCDDLCGTS